jgi:hypothetical protein
VRWIKLMNRNRNVSWFSERLQCWYSSIISHVVSRHVTHNRANLHIAL